MSTHEHDHGECRKLLKDLSDYVDGELDQALCVEIERHMDECDNCRVVVDTLRKTVLLYHSLPPEPMPVDVEARLFRRLDLEAFAGAG
jgi:anti-sigma factor RsiW